MVAMRLPLRLARMAMARDATGRHARLPDDGPAAATADPPPEASATASRCRDGIAREASEALHAR